MDSNTHHTFLTEERKKGFPSSGRQPTQFGPVRRLYASVGGKIRPTSQIGWRQFVTWCVGGFAGPRKSLSVSPPVSRSTAMCNRSLFSVHLFGTTDRFVHLSLHLGMQCSSGDRPCPCLGHLMSPGTLERAVRVRCWLGGQLASGQKSCRQVKQIINGN